MCYNCGCGLPKDSMGSDKTITDQTFEEAAKAMGQTPEEAKEETYKLLKRELGKN